MKINYYKLTESEMNDIPSSAGSLYRTTDTDKMYLDPINGTNRILLEVESVN